jgi:hypothetical protein
MNFYDRSRTPTNFSHVNKATAAIGKENVGNILSSLESFVAISHENKIESV